MERYACALSVNIPQGAPKRKHWDIDEGLRYYLVPEVHSVSPDRLDSCPTIVQGSIAYTSPDVPFILLIAYYSPSIARPKMYVKPFMVVRNYWISLLNRSTRAEMVYWAYWRTTAKYKYHVQPGPLPDRLPPPLPRF
ncbi:unnamed protein product [Toxocara canis]|uniref:Uncharacterized protein n=1 Tax=Toxocara canis TaxID=6265 RepID=A0A183TVL2_TOXCA|nr:unnamed protein product [Toxocara canis]